MRRADGAVRWMQLSSTPSRLPTGGLSGTASRRMSPRRESELRIEHLNRVYAVLSGINHTNRARKRSVGHVRGGVSHRRGEGAVSHGWIGMLEPDGARIRPVASAGMVDGYLDLLNIDLRNPPEACGPVVRAMLMGSHVISNDIERDQLYSPWRNEALRRGYRSSGVFPIKAGGQLAGHISLYADETGFFDKDELLLLDELAMDIGFAYESHNLELRRQAAEASFKQSEERFAQNFPHHAHPISFSRLEDGIMVDRQRKAFCA